MLHNLPIELRIEIIEYLITESHKIDDLKELAKLSFLRKALSFSVCVLAVITESSRLEYTRINKNPNIVNQWRVSDNVINVYIPDKLCTRVNQMNSYFPITTATDQMIAQKREVCQKYIKLSMQKRLYLPRHMLLMVELHDYNKAANESVLLYRLPTWMFNQQRLAVLLRASNSFQKPLETVDKIIDPPISTHIDIINPMSNTLNGLIEPNQFRFAAAFDTDPWMYHRFKKSMNPSFQVVYKNQGTPFPSFFPVRQLFALTPLFPNFDENSQDVDTNPNSCTFHPLDLDIPNKTLTINTDRNLVGSIVAGCHCCFTFRDPYPSFMSCVERIVNSTRNYYYTMRVEPFTAVGPITEYGMESEIYEKSNLRNLLDNHVLSIPHRMKMLSAKMHSMGTIGYAGPFFEEYIFSGLAESQWDSDETLVSWIRAVHRLMVTNSKFYDRHLSGREITELNQNTPMDFPAQAVQRERFARFSLDMVFFNPQSTDKASNNLLTKELRNLYNQLMMHPYVSQFQPLENFKNIKKKDDFENIVLNRYIMGHNTVILPDCFSPMQNPYIVCQKKQFFDLYREFLTLITVTSSGNQPSGFRKIFKRRLWLQVKAKLQNITEEGITMKNQSKSPTAFNRNSDEKHCLGYKKLGNQSCMNIIRIKKI